MRALLVQLILGPILALPLFAQEVRIRQQPSHTRVVQREGVIYCPLLPLAQELGAVVTPAGEGYRVGPSQEAVPPGKVRVHESLLDLQDEGGEPLVAAEAFCVALGGKVTHPERGVANLYPAPPAAAPVRADDPASFYFSQIRSASNPTGTPDNGNCGPACLAMAARAFQRWPLEVADQDLPGMMSWVRRAMGHKSDEMEGTNIPWLTRAAAKLGLKHHLFTDFAQLPAQLQKGRMVIVAGYLKNLDLPGGSHAMLVVGARGQNYLVNDPGLFFKSPGTPLTRAQLQRFFVLGIAVGKS